MKTYINPPSNCDLCKGLIEDKFIDGKTIMGCWANMCPDCFGDYGKNPEIAVCFIHQGEGKYTKEKS